MVQIIKKEWQITKMYIYEVVLQEGIIILIGTIFGLLQKSIVR